MGISWSKTSPEDGDAPWPLPVGAERMVGGQRGRHQGACDLARGPARGAWASAVQAGSNLKGMKGQEKPPVARMLGWRAGKLRPPQGLVGGGYQVRGAHPDPRGHRKQDREGRSQARLSTGVGWQAGWRGRQASISCGHLLSPQRHTWSAGSAEGVILVRSQPKP